MLGRDKIHQVPDQENRAMKTHNKQCRTACSHALLAVVATLVFGSAAPRVVHAAPCDGNPGRTVACLLPGQIHSMNGQASLGARRSIRTTPSECRERGGEYTVDERASQPMYVPHLPVASIADNRIVHCLLPRQLRQLGEKVRYVTARRPIRITRANCARYGGDVIGAAQARRAEHVYLAATRPHPAPGKQP